MLCVKFMLAPKNYLDTLLIKGLLHGRALLSHHSITLTDHSQDFDVAPYEALFLN